MIKLSTLLEKKGDIYEYGCIYMTVKFSYLSQIHKLINPDDLYEEEGDRTYGFEDEPHITLLYGVNPDIDINDIKPLVSFIYIPKLKINNISCFDSNENYDVLKFDIEGGRCEKLNNRLQKLPHQQNEDKYHPHLTICYLKKGKADKYIKKFKDIEYIIIPNRYVFSLPNGIKKNIVTVQKTDHNKKK